jgi:hypothetical protein
MRKTLPIIFLVLLTACSDNKSKRLPVQVRDAIMTKYFQIIDTLEYLDTLDLKFKLLKAYHDNDTNFLKSSYEKMAELLEVRKALHERHNFSDEPPPLNTFGYKQAYRFDYETSFCDQSVSMTIGKSSDKVVLDVYLYQISDRRTGRKTVTHETRRVGEKIWDVLVSGIEQSDFWGLQEDNGRQGLDGSALIVTGYEKPVNAFDGRYKKIYRWAAEDMTIGILFKNLLHLSGTTIDCFHF